MLTFAFVLGERALRIELKHGKTDRSGFCPPRSALPLPLLCALTVPHAACCGWQTERSRGEEVPPPPCTLAPAGTKSDITLDKTLATSSASRTSVCAAAPLLRRSLCLCVACWPRLVWAAFWAPLACSLPPARHSGCVRRVRGEARTMRVSRVASGAGDGSRFASDGRWLSWSMRAPRRARVMVSRNICVICNCLVSLHGC